MHVRAQAGGGRDGACAGRSLLVVRSLGGDDEKGAVDCVGLPYLVFSRMLIVRGVLHASTAACLLTWTWPAGVASLTRPDVDMTWPLPCLRLRPSIHVCATVFGYAGHTIPHSRTCIDVPVLTRRLKA